MFRDRLVPLVVLLVLGQKAAAAHICWVERVAQTGDELHVFLREGYSGAARGITHPDGERAAVTLNANGSFTIHDGDRVYFSTLPHDSCSGKAVTRGGKFGLVLEATACMPGMGCSTVRDFITAE